MKICPVLVEGWSDRPVMLALLQRHFGWTEGLHFTIHPHAGRGKIPDNLNAKPTSNRNFLLDNLPSKLRGYAHHPLVMVLMDLDDRDIKTEKRQLENLLQRLDKKPKQVLFGFAIEEVESWFIADTVAVSKAFPEVNLRVIARITPDAIVGAAEKLAEALGFKNSKPTGMLKLEWAEKIAPHLNFEQPGSPSLCRWIKKIEQASSHLGSTVNAP